MRGQLAFGKYIVGHQLTVFGKPENYLSELIKLIS